MTPRTDAICITPIMGEECTPHKWEQLQKLCRELEVSLSDSPNIARWIPMTERAPEDGADVIVFDDDKPFRWVGECRHCLTRGEHFFYGGGEGDCHYRVTHWMPMPEPPK